MAPKNKPTTLKKTIPAIEAPPPGLRSEPYNFRKRRRSVTPSSPPTGTRARKPKPESEDQNMPAMTTRSKKRSSDIPSGTIALSKQPTVAQQPYSANDPSPDIEFISQGPVPEREFKPPTQEQLKQIILRVSLSSNSPDEAPVSVPMEMCPTLESLFEEMLAECGLVGDDASKVRKISATYTWSKRRHLVRRGKASDWYHFWEYFRRELRDEGERVLRDGYEIEMLVHVD